MEPPNFHYSTVFSAARAMWALAELLSRPEIGRRTAEFLASQGWDRNRAIRLAMDLDALAARQEEARWYETTAAVTIKEAAQMTGLKYALIMRWAKLGLIRARQQTRSRRWYVHLEDVKLCKQREEAKP